MRIAIIGSGIAGLTAGWLLHRRHDITLFEAATYVGGHTHTVDVESGGRTWPVDTGFIVFNGKTYPNFCRMLDALGVARRPTTMSFSVRCERTGLEYNGTSLNSLFAQRRNLVRPSFWRMIRDILRFNREAPAVLGTPAADEPLDAWLAREGYSEQFREHYLVPMGSAIWSMPPEKLRAFPLGFFVRFFHNHGMLTVDDRPPWYVVEGGSRSYVEPLTAAWGDRIRLDTPVREVRRFDDRVTIDGESFDAVLFACHSDTARALLADPSDAEREILGALPYQPNEAVLHTDTSLLPRRRLARAAWNYHLQGGTEPAVGVTYDMNRLQGLDAPETFCLTLNRGACVDPAKVLRRIVYHHPVYTREGVAAQARHGEINGRRRTYYAGAYWGYGFHEDGVRSALAACLPLGVTLESALAPRPVEIAA